MVPKRTDSSSDGTYTNGRLKIGVLAVLLLCGVYGGLFVLDGFLGYSNHGQCPDAYTQTMFAVTPEENTSGRHIEIRYTGEFPAKANKTYIETNEETMPWTALHRSQSAVLTYGDNVSVTTSSGNQIRVVYQMPPPDRSPFNPLEEPCYTDRNQTIATYETV